jgi:hypothetical protein
MGDSDEENQSSAPAWQQAQSTTEPSASTDSDKSRAVTLEQAKKFLQDADVQKQTRERKTAFLQSKGISASDIENLLAGDDAPETHPTTEVCLLMRLFPQYLLTPCRHRLASPQHNSHNQQKRNETTDHR